MKPKLILITTSMLFTFTCLQNVKAQSKITGIVQNVDGKPISGASILLLHPADSSLVKGTTSSADGSFSLNKISPGNYLVQCSNIGNKDHHSKPFSVDTGTINLGFIKLAQQTGELKGVTVTTRKPMFEQKIDRMVVNVKNSITSAGGTVLEVLEKSPGVIVNRSTGAVSMNGKDGVMIMINGKINYMPQDAVLQMLNGINASNVEKIELITTPPAQYDAGGNAGYINIVLINNPNEGFNGSYSLSIGVGKGTFPSANTNFNYRKKNSNIYGSYSFSRLAVEQIFQNYRRVTNNSVTNEISIISNRDPYQRNHNARLGVDFKLGKKTFLGALISGYDNKWAMDALNKSVSTKNFLPDTTISIDNTEINYWKHAMGNINLQHSIKEGEELSVNADYLYYHNDNPTAYLNSYYDGNKNFLYKDNTASGKETVIKIWVSQIDYSKKLNEKTNLQVGAKASISRFTNNVLVEKKLGNDWMPDPDYTNNYFLKENIGAAYLSVDKKINENTNLKAGLRYEYTTSGLGSETEKKILDRQYGNLFPTFYINRQLKDNKQLNFSYNRRINRPAFTQLAPFLIFFDPKTFISGNSSLQPAITDALKIDYLIKKIVFSAGYSYESNTIARFQSEIDTLTNKEITTPQNMDNSKLIYLSASLPVQIAPWWFSQLNLAGNWNQLTAVYKNEPITFSQFYYTVSGAESLTLPKKFSIELSGFFRSKSFLFGSFEVESFGSLNTAIQKKFKNNGSLTFGVDNIFNSMKFKTSLSLPEQNIETRGSFLFFHRQFKLTWSQNFGNKALKDKRNRITASEEERQRV